MSEPVDPADFLTPDRCWINILNGPDQTDPRPAVFLDRDGVLVEEKNYLADPEGVEVIAGTPRAIHAARALGYRVVVVTNQSGIGRGRFDWHAYAAVENRMLEMLDTAGAKPDAVFACPHHPSGIAPYAVDHPWRKPAPGMLFAARDRLAIDLGASVIVGDKLSDLRAGHAAGLQTLVHVLTGHGAADKARVSEAATDHLKGLVTQVASIADLPGLLETGTFARTAQGRGQQ